MHLAQWQGGEKPVAFECVCCIFDGILKENSPEVATGVMVIWVPGKVNDCVDLEPIPKRLVGGADDAGIDVAAGNPFVLTTKRKCIFIFICFSSVILTILCTTNQINWVIANRRATNHCLVVHGCHFEQLLAQANARRRLPKYCNANKSCVNK